MNPCIVIPCYEHAATVGAIARAAAAHCPVIVVDDGSRTPLPCMDGCEILRLDQNCGKGAALRAGFKRALELDFTHAITIDADGQHFADETPAFLEAARKNYNALILGVRDFHAAKAPAARRWSNALSSFWCKIETGLSLADTQCGFRCYPLALIEKLNPHAERYAFELEILVRAALFGAPIVTIPIRCEYRAEHLRNSRFRPIRDFAHIAVWHARLLFQARLRPAEISSATPGSNAPAARALP